MCKTKTDLVSEAHSIYLLEVLGQFPSWPTKQRELQHKAKFSIFLNELKQQSRPTYRFVDH